MASAEPDAAVAPPGPGSALRSLKSGISRVRAGVRRRVPVTTVDVLQITLGPEDAERYRQLAARDGNTSIHAGRDEHDPVIRRVLPQDRLELLHERMSRGHECHVVLVDGEPVGWCWFARRSHRDGWSGLRVKLRPGEVYFYDLFVDPDRRRGGLALTIGRALLLGLSEEPSIRVAYCWVEQYNTPSQRLLREVLGFTQLGTVRYARLFDRYGVTIPFGKSPRSGPIG